MKSFPYVQEYRDNRGKVRRYFRKKGGPRIALPGEPGSPAFMEAYTAALSGLAARGGRSEKRCQPGSVAALAASYYASSSYLGLRQSTKRTYRSVLDPWIEANGEKPVRLLERRHIKRDFAAMAGTPGQANKWLKRIRLLMAHAIDIEMIKANPAEGIKLYGLGNGAEPWPEDVIKRYEAFWPVGSKPRLAFDLLLCTGQRRSDVVAFSKSHIRDGAISFRQKKTGRALEIPLHPRLIESIAQTPSKCTTLLSTEYDRPFTADGFGNWFRDKCDRAGCEGYSAHGLRKAAGRRLAEVCTAHEIMSVLGHQSIKEAEKYTRDADQKKLARGAMEKIG